MPADRPTTIALISATPAAIPPATAALSAVLPNARLWNLLDDLLLDDANAAGGLTRALRRRMMHLIEHAIDGGADAALLTCSLYGPVASNIRASWDWPVHGPDEALFDEVITGGGRIGLVASNLSSLGDSRQRLSQRASSSGKSLAVKEILCAASGSEHDRQASVIAAAQPIAGDVDEFVLAQYSLSSFADALAEASGRPVRSGAQAAAVALKRVLHGGESAERGVPVPSEKESRVFPGGRSDERK